MEKQEIIHLIDKNSIQVEKVIHQKVVIWTKYEFNSGLWWLGLGLTLIPWILWILFRKKESADRMLYVGFFVMVISLTLNVVGDQFGLWHYRYNVIPVLPTYFPWDITLMPLTIMFLLEIKPNINPFLKAIFFSILAAYIAEPFFTWMQIYNPKMWNYSFSLPIHFIIYLIAHSISRRKHFSNLT